MPTLRLILGDQLSETISSLEDCDPAQDVVLLCEVMEEATYVKHHQKKIAFLFSAMRHFAQTLQDKGFRVQYTKLEDPLNTGSFDGEVKRTLLDYSCDALVVTHPGEYRVLAKMQSWETAFGVPVDIRPDTRFLCSNETFEAWATPLKQLRMENFYRIMRRQYAILIDKGAPIGGQWNYDAENRKSPDTTRAIPAPFHVKPDAITQEVLALVKKRFGDHFGDLMPFHFAVTRGLALDALLHFITTRLPFFGDYQDAMIEGNPWMYHSHIGFYLNCGLLLPLECIKAAEAAFYAGEAPLNAVEGFIHQIMGWREYVRGIYWLKMPDYANANFFEAKRPLPDFYWTAKTKMNCLRQCIQETQQNAYAHHIQRLMVLGNFALIAGIDPAEVNNWFLVVYADAYEWVELPNVSGMILFADGGYLASKPYASGGNYIHKMSNYCQNCTYDIRIKNGKTACPFHYLYWNFLARNRSKLQSNHRLRMMYAAYDRMTDQKKQAIRNDSEEFLSAL